MSHSEDSGVMVRRSQYEDNSIRGTTGVSVPCTLYWLAKDLFEKENDEVAEPEARGLRDIRHHIEHKYLRVTVTESPAPPPGDLAFMVSREQFGGKAKHLMKLARSALIYLSIGVRFEEHRREPDYAGMPFEGIPQVPWLTDAEKV